VAWCDELAKWRHPQETWDMLQFGLRLGEAPRVVVTTTPRPMPLLQRLVTDRDTLLARTPTLDNRRFLAPQFLREIEARYGGTRLGRQELDAEIIDDDPDALFRRDLIEAGRARSAPDLVRIVVAIDPPASSRAGANACGIVCAGLGVDGKGYVLDDATLQGASPSAWASRAIALYHSRSADRLIAEVNQGGDMVEAVIREVDPSVSFRAVHASRGKRLRAEPVAALYEQGRIVHVGVFPELEDELVSFDQRSLRPSSPDRADALVWALSELMLGRRRVPRLRVV
jgi:phage terminase large subunit-like protein